MTMQTRRRHLQALLGGCGVAALSGCATILHPERKGNYKGRIAVGSLILDLLWFIPGLIPGVIALVVDFSSGAIYLGGSADVAGPERVAVLPGETITVNAPEGAQEAHATLTLLGPDGTVLDRSEGRWSSQARSDLRVTLADDAPIGEGSLALELRRGEDTQVVRHPLRLGAA